MRPEQFWPEDHTSADPSAGSAAHSTRPAAEALHDYPELDPVVSLAVDTVASAFDISDQEQRLLHRLDETVAEATVDAYAPLAGTAERLAEVEQDARLVRSVAVARSADVMALDVAETAAALEADTTPARPLTATQGAALVHRAARARSEEREREAGTVARAAVTAASTVARAARADAAALRREESSAASTIQDAALDGCYQVALEAGVEAAEQLGRDRVD